MLFEVCLAYSHPALTMDPTSIPAPSNSNATEDKTIAIVSYLTLIGFIVALILHGNKKTRLGAYHLRQSLGLMLTAIAVAFAVTIMAFIPFIGWFAGMVAWIGLL